MPLQSLLITVLIAIVTAMMAIGANLLRTSTALSDTYADKFKTIGIVEQKPNSFEETAVWDARKQNYTLGKSFQYDQIITEEDITFPEINYITAPEKRSYYGSYAPEYLHMSEIASAQFAWYKEFFVVEFSPLEDCVPDESILIHITKVLGDDKNSKLMENLVVWFCDHNNRYPAELKSDTTYIAALSAGHRTHGAHWDAKEHPTITLEYVPTPINTSLFTGDGKRISDTVSDNMIYIVSDGFYETQEGQRFLSMTDTLNILTQTQPVLGTNSTDILMPFYTGNAYICEGRDITEDEYEQGAAVCLAPKTFALNNDLSVGDTVTTRLLFTNASQTPDANFELDGFLQGLSIMDEYGKNLKPFEENEYTIVGIYDYSPMVSGIGADELIVTRNSIQNKNDSIVAFSPMNGDTTSFQIENGSIEEFTRISEQYDTENLLFTFYDMGYSSLQNGIQNMKNMSVVFLVMGSIAAVILMLQIAYIYVTKQTKSLMIERLIGISRRECQKAALAGVLMLLLIGTVPGIAAGAAISDHVGTDNMGQEYFDKTYSNVGISEAEKPLAPGSQSDHTILISAAMGILILTLGTGISAWKIQGILSREPMELIGSLR